MQVFLQIVAFSLQADGTYRPVLTKGKRTKTIQVRKWFNIVCFYMKTRGWHARSLACIPKRKYKNSQLLMTYFTLLHFICWRLGLIYSVDN